MTEFEDGSEGVEIESTEAPKPKYHKWHLWSAETMAKMGVKALGDFIVFRQLGGIRHVFYVEDNLEVTRILDVEGTLDHQIGVWLNQTMKAAPPMKLVEAIRGIWLNQKISVPGMPEPFLFADQTGYTYKKLPFMVTQASPYVAWEEFLSRLSDRDAFMAFVWSCFDKASQARQYVWLKGGGQDGKSVVLRVIGEVFGNAAGSLNSQHISKGNQFLFSAIFGKRVLIYGDCKDSKFGMREITRNLTGRDPVTIEFKGEKPFTDTIYAKLFVASNYAPEITGVAADLSRILYLKVSPSKQKDDPTWEKRLKDELPGFLYACKELYEKNCPHHGNIRVSNVSDLMAEEAVDLFEDEFADVFHKYFEFDKLGSISGAALRALTRLDLIGAHKPTGFREWLARKEVKRMHTVKGSTYVGMKLKGSVLASGAQAVAAQAIADAGAKIDSNATGDED